MVIKMKNLRFLILSIIALLSLSLKQYYLSLLLFYLIFLLSWKSIFTYFYPLLYGIPLPQIQVNGNVALVDIGFIKKYSIIYKVSLVKHTIEDLISEDFWRVTKYLFAGLPLSKEISITFISLKHENLYDFFIKIDFPIIEEEKIEEIRAFIRSLKKTFENSGISLTHINYNEYEEKISEILSWKEKSMLKTFVASTFTIVILTLLIIFGDIFTKAFFAPIFIVFTLMLTVRLKLRKHPHGDPEKQFYKFSKNYSMEGLIDEETVYGNSQSLYTVVSTLKTVLLAISVKRLPTYTREDIGKKAYSLYELGTALDKLSLLAKSKFLYEIVDKRIRRGEYLHIVNTRIFSTNDKALLSCLDSIGFQAEPSKPDLGITYILY